MDNEDFDDDDDELLALFEYQGEVKKYAESSGSNHKESQVDSEECRVPTEFPFPFEPYDIQKDFMNDLYKCFELSKVGIFESPTGTGKSLSLICGSLKWLKDYQHKQRCQLASLLEESNTGVKTNNENSEETTELDWIKEYEIKKEKEEQLAKVKQEQDQIAVQEAKVSRFRAKKGNCVKRKRPQLEDEFDNLMKGASKDIQEAFKAEIETQNGENVTQLDDNDEDDDLVLNEYKSDDEEGHNSDSGEEKEEAEHITKIYYCSRTHSQLSQFVREIMKSPFAENVRVVSLGSRQNLCINEAVKRLKSLSLMNDTCLDMQKNKSKNVLKDESGKTLKKQKNKAAGCPFYKQESTQDLTERMLADVMDMEQIVSTGSVCSPSDCEVVDSKTRHVVIGCFCPSDETGKTNVLCHRKQVKACPYYSSRFAIPPAEVVVLPYNTLIHKSTREATGIRLAGNIVIIDEAHNLLETINAVYSTMVTGTQLLKAHSQLSQYETRFRSRLKAKNLMYIKQILFILSCIIKYLGGKAGVDGDKQFVGKPETKLCKVNDFLFQAQLDNLNLFKVLQYCRKSQISKKLNGFAEKYKEAEVEVKHSGESDATKSGLSNFLKEITKKEESKCNSEELSTLPKSPEETLRSPLMHIEGFLDALTNADKDGRIVFSKQSLLSQCSLKFLLLNPAVHFSEIVKEARSVLVAGGTMQPVDEFKDQLFFSAGVGQERVMQYTCGHVIPANHLLALSLASGPQGTEFDFTYQCRENSKLLNELGLLVSNICQVVPDGIVVFFPSYEYQRLVYSHWEKTGVLLKLGRKKKVFQEPKKASQVDQVLSDYSACIRRKMSTVGGITGAILFCVVGGKMSEGINFSDELGRCVIMVGMPYPNIKSPELQEKMEYLNANFKRDKDGRKPGQVHYENLCMKAVNQSIGRAIRHRNDYATIVLVDKRYGRGSTTSKLPKWIANSLQNMEKYGPAISAITKFFTLKGG